ncbi:hypothetical protein [Verminephrobacter eiseniae]|uniref:hypothetical protein n=1 Tax=Verminephrobacter eiseniae TaxID=364317 RepID=UPI0005A529AE|nr:hypothetical protein [Verminephrobacter eiseniae]
MSAASLIATHMNAPYGKLVSAGDVVASLKSGFLAASTQEANGILEALFTEVPPDLILKCADQIQAPLGMVNHLYQVTLDRGLMHSQAWEDAVGALA